jgi:hypothetical protein
MDVAAGLPAGWFVRCWPGGRASAGTVAGQRLGLWLPWPVPRFCPANPRRPRTSRPHGKGPCAAPGADRRPAGAGRFAHIRRRPGGGGRRWRSSVATRMPDARTGPPQAAREAAVSPWSAIGPDRAAGCTWAGRPTTNMSNVAISRHARGIRTARRTCPAQHAYDVRASEPARGAERVDHADGRDRVAGREQLGDAGEVRPVRRVHAGGRHDRQDK